jgi:hypothetical protein
VAAVEGFLTAAKVIRRAGNVERSEAAETAVLAVALPAATQLERSSDW